MGGQVCERTSVVARAAGSGSGNGNMDSYDAAGTASRDFKTGIPENKK